MVTCFLSLGSNLRSPERQLRLALAEIKKRRRLTLLKVSSLYFTKPIGVRHQPNFCNAVVMIRTSLPPHQLLLCCQAIETQQGRVRKRRWGPRTLDIDLLLYGNLRLNHPRLCLPHPEMMNRDFVLTPLLEIAPNALR